MRRYADTIAQAAYGERLGFESVGPAEQHFALDTSIMPSPLLLLSAIAVQTSTLRLGTGVVPLPAAAMRRRGEHVPVDRAQRGGAEGRRNVTARRAR